MRKGGGRNEQKANEDRVRAALDREQEARSDLEALESLAVNARPSDYRERLKELRGILKQAVQGRKKSETHSRKPKGANR